MLRANTATRTPLRPAPRARATRITAAVVVALGAMAMATGCPKAGVDKPTTATAAPSPPWWMSIKDGKLHRGLDEAPIGLYAAGEQAGADGGAGRFVPGGDIEGSGPIGDKGTPGFLDLATGTFVNKSEPHPPPPYIEGAMTPSGFSPASRHVVYR